MSNRLKMFAIFDVKAKAYLSPFFLPEIGQAVRTFGDCVDDPNHNFGKHPEDYSLFMVGTFDVVSGRLEVAPTLELVCTALALRAGVSTPSKVNGGIRSSTDLPAGCIPALE